MGPADARIRGHGLESGGAHPRGPVTLPSATSALSRREIEALVRAAVDEGGIERAPAARIGRQLGDPAVLAAVAEAAHEAKLRWRGDRRHGVAQRLPAADQPVPRSLHLLHVREAPGRSRREDLHARRGRRGLARGRARRLHRGALLSRRQAGAGVRVAIASGSPRRGTRAPPPISSRRVASRSTDGHAAAHQRRLADAAADGGAAAVERVDGSDARDHERAADAEGRGAPRGARQAARAAAAHARRGRRARDPVHDRHAARHRRDRGRAHRHALRDPRSRGPLRPHPGGDPPALPSEGRHQDERSRDADRRRRRRDGSRSRGSCSGRTSRCRRRRTW